MGQRSTCTLSRWEIYQRTVGYAVNGIGPLAIILLIQGVPILFNLEKAGQFLAVWIPIDMGLMLLVFVIYWKYFFDIILKSIEQFEGQVSLGKFLPGTVVQSSELGRRRQLFECVSEECTVGQKFIVFEDILKAKYNSKSLIFDICNGPVVFRYMKRTKCVVEICKIEMGMETQQSLNKHYLKKLRRKQRWEN